MDLMIPYREDADILRVVIRTRSIHLVVALNSTIKDKSENAPIKYLFTIHWIKPIVSSRLKVLMCFRERIIMRLFLVIP